MNNKSVSVLITDLDNTLYDWFEAWYQSFRPMLTKLSQDSAIAEELLIKEIKKIHERHCTSEYLMLINEIPSLKEKHPDDDLGHVYADAIQEYRAGRDASLRLFPTVAETLRHIKEQNAVIIGYTESQAFYSDFRIKHLRLDGVLDFLYSPETHELPSDTQQSYFFPMDRPRLHYTKHRHTPSGEIKPNPDILLSIIEEIGAVPDDVIYVGDSLTKDIAMAQAANVKDVLAKYGVPHSKDEYELLRLVTHWTEEAVEKERKTTEQETIPSFTLSKSYSELLENFIFAPFTKRK